MRKFVGLDITNIVAKLLNIFLLHIGIDDCRIRLFACSTSDNKRIFLSSKRAISLLLYIVVGELHRWYHIRTSSTRNSQILNHLRTANARGSIFKVVSHLRIVHLESLWPIHSRSLKEFHITRTLNHEGQGYRLISLKLGVRDIAWYRELSNSTAKPCRLTRWQWRYFYRYARCCERFGSRSIAIKKVIEDTTHLCSVAHAQNCLKLCRFDHNISTALWEQ